MSFVLNVAPISFPNIDIKVEKLPFSDPEFENLLCRYPSSHLIHRKGDSIFAIPLKASERIENSEIIHVPLSENLDIVCNLARRAMYDRLLSENCYINGYKPISYLALGQNMIPKCLPPEQSVIKGLALYPRWELDFRILNVSGENAIPAMCINVSTSPRITKTCQELLDAGVSLNGYYVGISSRNRNPEIKPRFMTLGKVVHVDGTQLILDDVRNPESKVVLASDVYLEPRQDVLMHCINTMYAENSLKIAQNIERYVEKFHNGLHKHKKLLEALKIFQKFNLSLVPGAPFSFRNFLSSTDTISNLPSVGKAENPIFVFAPGGQKTSNVNDGGIRTYGPYSRETFTPSKPRICVICQSKKKGRVEQVLSKLLDGMPTVQYSPGKYYDYTGLKSKYYLTSCILDFYVTESDSAQSYNKAISEAISAHGTEFGRYDLALVQIDTSFRTRTDNENPYLLSKARLIGQQIPVQEFTLEALGGTNEKVLWTINNMSLAKYAKLNGIPWLLKADRPIAHEIVIGIGSAIVGEGRFGSKERMVGITTVFSGDGNYYLSNVSSAVYQEEYFETLLDNLRSTLTSLKKELNWQPRDTVRLVFHAFKEFNNFEAKAVKIRVGELGDYNVEFAFVHVAQDHPFLLFDTRRQGLGQAKKGIFAPDRGTFVSLTHRITLVSLTGSFELKRSTDGIPTPVQLILHRDSTFRDMTYLAKQVVNFGAHSWRGFSPAPMPVTVFYSQLVAQMIGKLSNITYWSPDSVLNRIGSTRWFL